MIKQKKAAIELSVGTIVIIVIAMSMLILGIVLVRQVMCAGIVLTDQVTKETESQIINLFGSDDLGVKCQGEEGDKVTFGSGGVRPVVCISNLETGYSDHSMVLEKAEILRGRIGSYTGPVDITNTEIILDKEGWVNSALSSGKNTIVVSTLDIPNDVDKATIKLTYRETTGSTVLKTHPLIIEVVPVGSFAAAIC